MTESTSLSPSEILRIILSDEKLKKKIVEALSESFATKGDILTVLNEIKKLREDHNRDVKTILAKLEEMQKEHNRKIERIWAEIERLHEEGERKIKQIWDEIKQIREEGEKERQRIWDEIKQIREEGERKTKQIWDEIKQIRENMQKSEEEHNRKIERIWAEIERLREEGERKREKIWDEIKALREDFNKFGLKLDALGARWGIMSEESFRNALRGILENWLNVKVIKWEDYDKEGLVFHAPSIVEIDVVIKNEKHTLIELKSHISKSDVATFLRKAEFYEKKTGIKPKLIMISPFIERKAKEFAYQHDIKLYTSSYDEIEI